MSWLFIVAIMILVIAWRRHRARAHRILSPTELGEVLERSRRAAGHHQTSQPPRAPKDTGPNG